MEGHPHGMHRNLSIGRVSFGRRGWPSWSKLTQVGDNGTRQITVILSSSSPLMSTVVDIVVVCSSCPFLPISTFVVFLLCISFVFVCEQSVYEVTCYSKLSIVQGYCLRKWECHLEGSALKTFVTSVSPLCVRAALSPEHRAPEPVAKKWLSTTTGTRAARFSSQGYRRKISVRNSWFGTCFKLSSPFEEELIWKAFGQEEALVRLKPRASFPGVLTSWKCSLCRRVQVTNAWVHNHSSNTARCAEAWGRSPEWKSVFFWKFGRVPAEWSCPRIIWLQTINPETRHCAESMKRVRNKSAKNSIFNSGKLFFCTGLLAVYTFGIIVHVSIKLFMYANAFTPKEDTNFASTTKIKKFHCLLFQRCVCQ